MLYTIEEQLASTRRVIDRLHDRVIASNKNGEDFTVTVNRTGDNISLKLNPQESLYFIEGMQICMRTLFGDYKTDISVYNSKYHIETLKTEDMEDQRKKYYAEYSSDNESEDIVKDFSKRYDNFSIIDRVMDRLLNEETDNGIKMNGKNEVDANNINRNEKGEIVW